MKDVVEGAEEERVKNMAKQVFKRGHSGCIAEHGMFVHKDEPSVAVLAYDNIINLEYTTNIRWSLERKHAHNVLGSKTLLLFLTLLSK